MTQVGSQPAAWLLSSAGRRGSLVRLLQSQPIRGDTARLVATDRSELSAAGHLADVFARVPSVGDEGFIPRTLEIALEHNVRVIIPTIDPEIELFATHRPLFANHGIDVWVSSPEVARLGWDKWLMHEWLVARGFSTAETYEIANLPNGALPGRVVAKPRSGSASRGVIYSDSQAALSLSELDEDYIVQSRAPGIEITVDFAVGKTGRVLGVVPRRRIEVRGGEVSKGVTVDYPKVVTLVKELAEALPGAYGALNAQVFYDQPTESARIIEINPRFGGGYPLTHFAGANFIDALLRDASDEDVAELEWQDGTLLLRYDSEVIVKDFNYRSLDD